MKTKSISSKICVLLAIIFFINPVIVTASALFSANSSSTSSSLINASSDSMPCHEGMNTDADIKQAISHTEMESDCCADLCLCDDSGCHTSSLVFQFNSNISFNTQQNPLFNLPIYLSLASTPSSPPPII